MDKFVVSARKYRPQNFSTVVGQSHITTTLKNAINNNQLAHAFLFCGPRGVGKTTCARILAKTINCEKRTKDGEACNKCNSCVSFDNGSSFNIHELDAASNNSVEDIRSLVEQIRFAPQAGKYKVYIVDEVHMLSQAAFNAFLKTLEEPPPYAIFILATTEKHKILPTILSRCQIFDFKRITPNDTVAHLEEIAAKEKITADKTALHLIAQKSEGCMRDSLSILDKIVSFTGGKITYKNALEHLNILDEDYYFKLIEQMQESQLAASLLLFDEINQKGFEADTLLDGLAECIRNLLVCKDPKSVVLLEVAEDFKEKYLMYAGKIDTGWLIAALNIIIEGAIQYKMAKNKRLHVELLLIKLHYLHQALQLSLTEEGLSKKKIVDSSKAVAFRALPMVSLPNHPQKIQPKKAPDAPSLVIEQPRTTPPIPKPTVAKTADMPAEKSIGKLGSLNKIRQQIAHKNNQHEAAKSLETDLLQNAWGQYIEKLIDDKNHSAVTNFKMAALQVIDENSFEIITENKIQQKFIESERAPLIAHLQQFFNNRFLTYQVSLIEKASDPSDTQRPLSSKEQYALLVAQYPLIKDLKDRLKLDLDFM